MLKTVVFIVPFIIYLGIVVGALALMRHRRKTRWPFKQDDRLLRGPGESLRREVSKLDESLVSELAGGVLAMLLVTWGAVSLNTYFGGTPWMSLFAGAMACLFTTLLSTRRILNLWQKRHNYFLGWFGERIVAEKLAPLRFLGWRVFHDVPFVSNGKPFNMDHIVVGEGGVFVIETKTRRKGGSSGDGPDDVVYFDGQALHWPRNKNDESGLRQAELNAQTLTKWIYDEIGERIPTSPILAIPGWSLEFRVTKTRRPCKVDSPNWILNTFKNHKPSVPQKTVELITRRLLAKCRDVED